MSDEIEQPEIEVPETEVPETEPDAPAVEQPPAGKSVFLARITVLIAIVALALGVACVVLQVRKPGSDGLDATRASALSSAKTRVPEMLTYTYKTIDTDIARATAQVTGPFKDQYSTLLSTRVKPGAVSGKVSTKATAVEAGVMSASKTKVDVLVFLDLTTTSGTTSTPQVNGSRVRVTMKKVNGTWLVSALEPV
ncbi:MAG TPA: hypothetical protein VHZ06_00540 [Marmoricola sp.]|jgi:Mce-associated membrane protein|nr:hypothetical protein [Marmoricola sp.]